MEDNLKVKEQLVEEAKKLAESEDSSGKQFEVPALLKKWKRTSSEEESLLDQELADKFYGYINEIKKSAGEFSQTVEERKNEIIAKVKELGNSENYKKATETMNELFESFKTAGRCAKDTDDQLWAEFKAAKDEFYAKKKMYFEELSKKFAQNKEAKEALIERAKEILGSENFQEAGKKMDELMVEWKSVGNAGKESNDDLWISFNDVRKEFYKKKNEYYAGLRETYAQRAEAKKALIERAKKCLAFSEFTEEEVAKVKQIRADWKAVGFAGKDNEDNLWKEFNETMNLYFENKKVYGNN